MREVETGVKSEDVDWSLLGNERVDQVSIVCSCMDGQPGSSLSPVK